MLWIPAEVIAKSLRIPVLYTSLVYMHNPTIVHEIHQLTQEVVSAEAFQFIFHLEDFAEIEFIAVRPHGIYQCPGI